MKHQRSGCHDRPRGSTSSRVANISSAMTSRYAALRREQNIAARRLAALDSERGIQPTATCRIATARDRRTAFVWRSPRRGR